MISKIKHNNGRSSFRDANNKKILLLLPSIILSGYYYDRVIKRCKIEGAVKNSKRLIEFSLDERSRKKYTGGFFTSFTIRSPSNVNLALIIFIHFVIHYQFRWRQTTVIYERSIPWNLLSGSDSSVETFLLILSQFPCLVPLGTVSRAEHRVYRLVWQRIKLLYKNVKGFASEPFSREPSGGGGVMRGRGGEAGCGLGSHDETGE